MHLNFFSIYFLLILFHIFSQKNAIAEPSVKIEEFTIIHDRTIPASISKLNGITYKSHYSHASYLIKTKSIEECEPTLVDGYLKKVKGHLKEKFNIKENLDENRDNDKCKKIEDDKSYVVKFKDGNMYYKYMKWIKINASKKDLEKLSMDLVYLVIEFQGLNIAEGVKKKFIETSVLLIHQKCTKESEDMIDVKIPFNQNDIKIPFNQNLFKEFLISQCILPEISKSINKILENSFLAEIKTYWIKKYPKCSDMHDLLKTFVMIVETI